MRAMQKGTLVHRVQEFHSKYGEMIRIGPNEISCINPQAWQDIYGGHKPGQNFGKNPLWMSRKQNTANSILSASDADHHRIRRLISHAFSDKALRAQEPILQEYVGILMRRLHEQTKAGWGSAVVDLVEWFSWTTFDIVGELGFGETFGCLTDERHHSWSALVFSHFKAASLVTSVRFYPLLERFLRWWLPSPVTNRQGHFQLSREKIHRRLKGGKTTPDFMSYVLDPKNEERMSLQEIETTFNILIIAGSETTASALAGTTGYLLNNPMCLATLIQEIRSNFVEENDINLASLGKLPYLSAVIEEGLRMAPPVPSGLPRVTPAEGGVVCGEWLPGGTDISFSQWSAYRSTLNFSRPNEFIPERWLQSNRTSQSTFDKKSTLQPFSFGPRNCIGKNLAYAELRLILSRMIWNFDLSFPKEMGAYDWAKQKTYVLVEKQPLKVRLTPRKFVKYTLD
jgi:cytochrome P450